MKRGLLPLALVAGLILTQAAFGQTPNNVVDTVQDSIINQAKGWETTLIQHATNLFWLLAGIEIGISAIWLAINGATLESWFGELVRRILFVGFFLFVLTQGPELAKAVVNSLFQIGSGAGSVSASDIFDAGVDVASKMTEDLSWWNPTDLGKNIIVGVCALVVIIAFGFMAAILLGVMLEMYIGLLAGLILLGFGGSSFTKDFAIKYLVYAFGIGMKIMVLVMIAAIGSEVLLSVANNPNIGDNFIGPASIAGLSLVVAMISQMIPPMVQGLVQGVSVGNGMEAIRGGVQTASFAAVGAGMAAGGAGVVKGGMAAASAASQAGASRGAAAMAGLKAAGGAVGSAATDKLMGIPGAKMGSTLGLANEKLRQGNNPGTSSTSSNRKMDADS